MPWTLAKLERDKDLIPIPQQWDDRAGKFVPLRVMEYFGNTIDERPLITDVPLGATYTVVDTQETWQSNGTEWLPKQTKVQLSGTIVEEQLIPRAIRNTNLGRVAINPPVGAYGVIVEHYIYGVTGTFGAGEGAILQVALMRLAGGTVGPVHLLSTASKTDPSSQIGQAIILYPGVSREEYFVRWFGVPPIFPLRVDVLISGEFEEGQGFDSAVNIRWLIGR